MIVAIKPPLPGRVIGSHADIDRLLLSPCTSDMSWSDVGRKVVMVDIYATRGQVAMRMTTEDLLRIGVGRLHSSLREAEEASPM